MDYLINLTKDNIQQVVDTSMQKLVVLAFWTQQQPESVQLLQTIFVHALLELALPKVLQNVAEI